MLICQPVWIIKRKVDDLDVGKVNTDPVDFKRLSKVVDNEVIIIAKFKNIKIVITKINNWEQKIPNATKLIHINQYNTGKQNLEKNWRYW